MKITLDFVARALGNARLDFYRFYAPSWSEPPALDELRQELAHRYPSDREPISAASRPRLVPPRPQPLGARPLPRAA